jgi:hypothetical protein
LTGRVQERDDGLGSDPRSVKGALKTGSGAWLRLAGVLESARNQISVSGTLFGPISYGRPESDGLSDQSCSPSCADSHCGARSRSWRVRRRDGAAGRL